MRNILRMLVFLMVAMVGLSPAWARTEAVQFEVRGTTFVADAADGMAGFVSQARTVVEETWPQVADRAGAADGETIRIHIELAFEDWFVRNNVPARPPEWAAGLAIPSMRVILLAPGNPAWEKTMQHELSHVAVAIAARDIDLPRWFDEGFAMRTAEQWDIERASTLLRATMSGGLHDFRQITARWPAGAQEAQIAYAQSQHFVRDCEQRYGIDIFARVLASVREGAEFSDAFQQHTGSLLTVAFDRWESSIQVGYRWAPIGVGGSAAWLLASGLFFWGWRRARRQRAEALKRMERAERDLYETDRDDKTFG